MRALYATGLLGLYHRLRNRRHLTVVMFHRVLPASDGRWHRAKPEWTLSTHVFEGCLRFFDRHYNVIALPDLLEALDGRVTLPERPLLITFDDGWSDTEQYALDILRHARMPATLFVSSGLVGASSPFWQDCVAKAWEHASDSLRSALVQQPDRRPPDAIGLQGALRSLASRSPQELAACLEPWRDELHLPRSSELLDQEHLNRWHASGQTIGSHGDTHQSLTAVGDLDVEVQGSKMKIVELLANQCDLVSLSFPNGRYDNRCIEFARAAGYRVLFTSDAALNVLGGCVREDIPLLGRAAVTSSRVTTREAAMRCRACAPAVFSPGEIMTPTPACKQYLCIPDNELSSRVVAAGDLTASECGEWEALRCGDERLESPFYSPYYAKAMATVLPHVKVCIVQHHGRNIGFLPYAFPSVAAMLLGAAEPVGGQVSNYFGLIGVPQLRLDSSTLLRLASLQYLIFRNLDETQTDIGLCGEEPRVGLRLRLPVEGSAAYWRALKSNDRKFVADTERLQRQIEKLHGPLRFCYRETNWRPALSKLIALKRLQYNRTSHQDALAASWKRAALFSLAETRAPGCSGILSTLYAGDTRIASHFGLRSYETLAYLYPVYDSAFGRYAPGRLLLKYLIDAAPEGLKVIDFGEGEAQYKLQFGNERHTFYNGIWRLPGWRSAVCRIGTSIRWRIEKSRVHR